MDSSRTGTVCAAWCALLTTAALLSGGCSSGLEAHGHAGLGHGENHAQVERAHQPWVFRSVLDGRARMITVALNDALWVAYDATDGQLVKAWRGGVDFDGAVYTTRHGPQPTSTGVVYADFGTAAGSVTWALLDAVGNAVPTRVRSLGYVRDGERSVTMRYELTGPDGDRVIVSETPEFEPSPGEGGGVLRRVLRVAEGSDRAVVFVRTGFLDRDGASLVSTHRPEVGLADAVGYQVIPGDETVIHMGFGTPEPADDARDEEDAS